MGKTTRPHRLSLVTRDTGYRWQERDPQMAELCTLIDQSEMTSTEIRSAVSKATGGAYTVAYSTIANWQNGKTKRPTNFTMTWVAFALGYERRWVRLK